MRKRRIGSAGALLGAVALAVGLLSSCGGGRSPFAVVEKAYADTLDAHTSRLSFATTVTAPGGTNVTQTGEGLVDFGAHKTQLDFGTPAQQGIHIVMVGKDVWTSLPQMLQARIPNAKPFVHVNVDGDDGTGDPMGRLVRPDDPAQTLGQLRSVSSNGVRKVGSEDVRGAKATQFTAQVDLDKVAAQDPAVKPHTDKFKQMLGTNLIPFDVWIDGQNHVRRVHATLNNLKVDPAVTISLAWTEEFWDFGLPATINPPPADQVMEAAQVQQALGVKPSTQPQQQTS